MVKVILPDIRMSIGMRICYIFYRIIWFIRPILRFFGIKLRFSWQEVMFATRLLSQLLSRYNPDLVIGVGVGGTGWGAILAGNLKDKPFIVLDRLIRWSNGNREAEVDTVSLCERREQIVSKRILLVFAEIISGQTEVRAKSYVEQFNPSQIRIACLNYQPYATITPDYYYICCESIIQKPWRQSNTYTCPDNGSRPD